jgi:outer membrane protein assembly factor BamB
MSSSAWPTREKTAARQSYIEASLRLPLEVAWHTPLPDLANSPLVASDKRIIIGAAQSVIAINAVSGTIDWQFVPNKPEAPLINGISSSPVIWHNRVYVIDQRGTLYCLEENSGRLIWELSKYNLHPASICLFENRLYCALWLNRQIPGAPGYMCLDLDGNHLWSYPTAGIVRSPAAAAHDSTLVFGDSTGRLYGLSTDSGQEKWQLELASQVVRPPRELGRIENSIHQVPIIVNGIVVVGYEAGNLFGVSLESGRLIWQTLSDTGLPLRFGHATAIATDRQRLYFIHRSLLRSIIIETGRLALSKDTYDLGAGTSPAQTGLVIGPHYLASISGNRFAVFDKETSELQFAYEADGKFMAGPIYVEGKVFVPNAAGGLYCFVGR